MISPSVHAKSATRYFFPPLRSVSDQPDLAIPLHSSESLTISACQSAVMASGVATSCGANCSRNIFKPTIGAWLPAIQYVCFHESTLRRIFPPSFEITCILRRLTWTYVLARTIPYFRLRMVEPYGFKYRCQPLVIKVDVCSDMSDKFCQEIGCSCHGIPGETSFFRRSFNTQVWPYQGLISIHSTFRAGIVLRKLSWATG